MSTRVITDPKTGRKHTVSSGPPIDLDKARRETRARIDGTEQFHRDPYAAPHSAAEVPACNCCLEVGYVCMACRDDE